MIIITGTSRGIGKELALLYLAQGKRVIGISRTASIEHENYSHLICDLSDPKQVEKLELPISKHELIFIHNAGILGEINRFSAQKEGIVNLNKVLQVNLYAGATIVEQLLSKTKKEQPFTVVFVSSGAGKRPIPSWSAYCASKAAVDIWLSTLQLEELENGRSDFRCLAIAPGVVDTEMQTTIRAAQKDAFSSSDHFSNLKDTGQLLAPKTVAQKISQRINEPSFDKVVCSITD
jgi:benzil reductase ((S)-benzoin forming)